MSDIAKQLFERMTTEIGAEMKRLATQGSNECASALFNGNAFVQYGPGQYTPAVEQEKGQEQAHEQEMGLER